jgi:predicted permease
VDAVVLRPLPFDRPERVMRVLTQSGRGATSASAASFLDWRSEGASRFERMAAKVGTGMALSGRDVPVLLDGARVSADYFRVFGVRPALGRGFRPEDDDAGRGNVVVLAARTWSTYFDADPRVIGRGVLLNGTPYTVIGVMPRSFDFLAESDALWVPLALTPEQRANRGDAYLQVIGRLRPGVSVAEAQATMDAVARRLDVRPGARRQDVESYGIRVRPYAAELTGDYRTRLLTLLGAVGFVLVIGCANVANLLLARGVGREREIALRSALGAGRARLVRQLLTESLVLALAGGAVGAALSVAGVRALVAIAPEGVPRLEQAGVDARVLLFTLGVSVACSLVVGLAPALRSARPELQSTLRAGGRGHVGGGRDRVRAALVVGEVALALVLLTGAGLLTRSAVLLTRVEPGFDPAGVTTARIMLPAASYPDAPRIVSAFERIVDEARRAPGVSSAAFVQMVPLADDDALTSVSAEGQPWSEETRLPVAFRLATRGYFETMRIRLRAGRDFTDRDDAAAPPVAIVNEALARRLWPGRPAGDAVGRRITGLAASPEHLQLTEIVGVVADVRDQEFAKAARPALFLPVAQTPPAFWPLLQRTLALVARGAPGAGAAGERGLREAVARVDRSLPLADPRSMEAYVAASLATSRFTTLLLGALSAIGLVLAAVGIYGVVAYFVTQRVPEFGVRVALGATPRHIVALVLGNGMRPVALGVVLGLGGSLAATRVLRGLLYGVTPTDAATVAAVVALLVGAALLAGLVPARRAARVDPAAVTRA